MTGEPRLPPGERNKTPRIDPALTAPESRRIKKGVLGNLLQQKRTPVAAATADPL